jgi:23S rRNA (uracil1939-C5)-methyltransferase
MARKRRRRGPRVTEPIEVVTTALGSDGRGRAEYDGRVVHVSGALAGERLKVELTGRRRGEDEGRVLEVLEASPDRVEPKCRHFGLCGGCTLQHFDPAAQLRYKQDALLAELSAAGVKPGRVFEPLVGPSYAYRRRARLGAKWVDKKDKVLVGFRERDKRFVADLECCEILAGQAGDTIPAIASLIENSSLKSAIPQVEVTAADEGLAFVFRVLEDPSPDDLRAFRAFEQEQAARVYLQRGGLDTVQPLDGGHAELSYSLVRHDTKIRFLPTDFVQVNAALNEAMVDLAIEHLDLQDSDRVLDLFCGLGNFTVPIARRVGAVSGLEGNAALVERARQNASDNGISNATFRVADLYQDAPEDEVWAQPWDKVLLDPPRSGAEFVMQRLVGLGTSRIVYVSCGPTSFVRDAALLVESGRFALSGVGVMDMFPHTTHVETIALFERS